MKQEFKEWRKKNENNFHVHQDVLKEFEKMKKFYNNDCKFLAIKKKYNLDSSEMNEFITTITSRTMKSKFIKMNEYKFLLGDKNFYQTHYPVLSKRIFNLHEVISRDPTKMVLFSDFYKRLSECKTLEEKKQVDIDFSEKFRIFK